jgi:dipeptidyl aminopeptidase/acylaminoacyl peptidase
MRHTRTARLATLVGLWLVGIPLAPARAQDPLLTVAEKSNYQATSRHAEVVDFCQRLAKMAPVVRLGELGTSFEGRKLPLLILADPPVASAEEAARSNKLVVYLQGNIHAGEVDGKEGLLMLARDLATGTDRALLKDLILVICPIFNADGNEKMSKTSRPGQVGPAEGAGVRTNGQDLDLNRDFVKLESPEVRALVRLVNQWNPAVMVDTHTTNGSHHRYTITYEGPRNPAGDGKLVEFVRDVMLPDLSQRLEKKGGYKSFFYGNFSRDRRRWETVPATPRYGIHYLGLRHCLAILSESYSYAPYRARVLASRDFVRSILEYTAEHKDQIRTLVADARAATVKAGTEPKPGDRVAIRSKAAPMTAAVNLLGFVEEDKDGRRVATDKPAEYRLEYFGRTEATLTVQRPYAYLLPASYTKVVENLQRHGIEVEELREDIELDVEVYRVTRIDRGRLFQKHQLVSVDATARTESRRVEAGTIMVRTGQPLGALALYLLEPQSEDGLVTWNFFDSALQEGRDFPVLRLPAATPITTAPLQPLPENRVWNKMITLETVPNLNGNPVDGLTWLEDGDHYLQVKDGKQVKVAAVTGRCEPFQLYDRDKLTTALRRLPTLDKETIGALVGADQRPGTSLHMDAQRKGAYFEYGNDLYYVRLDGDKAVRLTSSPGPKELPSFSPNGKFVAFVRHNNLYAADVATQTERALTTDGTALISNGKADWVYFEEIFNRSWRAYWWSPDSSHLIFLRVDDTPVHKFTVIDQIPIRQNVETTPYPKAGDPNPRVKVGIAPVAGGPVHFADLGDYSEDASLVIRAGFTPDSQRAYFYVQDRAQTWLDFCTVPLSGGKPTRLFRETTKAWVDDPGAPTFLKDGSFLFLSERNGWKHFYHYEADGKLKKQVTDGPWEVHAPNRVDEKGGWIYFSGTRDNPIGNDLYRVKVDGTGLERLTKTAGEHRTEVSPNGAFFIDSWDSYQSPPKVRLQRTDGAVVRNIDTNPVRALNEYKLGQFERVPIKTPDGFVLEGSLLKPANFDPQLRYPVWFMTYGGPHTPTIHDGWGGGRARDQALANLGLLIFRCDPRSASGKGAVSTWTAYRQLGVQELKDIETAIHWLIAQHPYVDPDRIGMSGHSYGGFLTAYALTHSQLFAAGIAGAPVTDWHNYDTIYTERFMNTPQENPEGYKVTSVVKAASKLHGKLLIVHGLMDDNVHVQNSAQFILELQRADKDFEVMFYPQSRHGIFGRHYQRLTVDFMKRNLLSPPAPAEKTR